MKNFLGGKELINPHFTNNIFHPVQCKEAEKLYYILQIELYFCP